jgi:hypothetical protein
MSDYIIPAFTPSVKKQSNRWNLAMSKSNYELQLAYYKQEALQGHYKAVYATHDKFMSRTITVVDNAGNAHVVFNETQSKQTELDYYASLDSLPYHAGDYQ